MGNCALFYKAAWVAQKPEYEAMFGPEPESFGHGHGLYATPRGNELRLVEGDHDVFGDGASRLISTPGHTPGHCSLLVRLPETGLVLLSGDVAHNREKFQFRRSPSFNAGKAATVASMELVDAILKAEGATFWINHDTRQSQTLPYAPVPVF